MLNNTKSHTVAIFGDSNKRTTVVDARATFTIQSHQVRAFSREESWIYLGIEFFAEGKRSRFLASQLSPLLQRLNNTSLKPKQRIYALKTTALPIYYHMAVGNINELQRVDKMVRATVRQWLALTNDSAVRYFHGNSGCGDKRHSSTSSDLGLLRYRRTPITPTSRKPLMILEREIFAISRRPYPAGELDARNLPTASSG